MLLVQKSIWKMIAQIQRTWKKYLKKSLCEFGFFKSDAMRWKNENYQVLIKNINEQK